MNDQPKADRTVYTDTREGGDVRCFYCKQPVGGLHDLDCPMFRDCDVHAKLLRVSDGVVRTIVMDHNSLLDPGFAWTEGNYGCDCNRELFFCRAADEDEPDEPECGDAVRFKMLDFKIVMREPK